MCTLLGDQAPTAEEWVDQGLDKYGVIAVLSAANGGVAEAAQVEKVSHETATEMLEELGTIAQVGPSLGSFSVSAAILNGLCNEFAIELTEKVAKLDTDPHFWMPLTLPETSYIKLMSQKGVDEDTSKDHYARMKSFSIRFDRGDLGLFGAVDVGKDACWWDYGQLKLYSQNSLLLLDDKNPESELLRKFLDITEKPRSGVYASHNVEYKHSYIFDCSIATGKVFESVLSKVTAREINVDEAIIVNCAAPKITAGKGAILYNLISDKPIVAQAGKVCVGVFDDNGKSMNISSRMEIDGGKAWKEVVEGNPLSFEDVRNQNMNADISQVDLKREERFRRCAQKIFR